MTQRQKQLIENYVRKQVRKSLREGSKDIRKVDRSNLAGTAEEILDAFISAGAKGVYDSDTTKGQVTINGTTINFSTGQEQLHFSIEKLSSHNPKEAISSLKKFLREISNYS